MLRLMKNEILSQVWLIISVRKIHFTFKENMPNGWFCSGESGYYWFFF